MAREPFSFTREATTRKQEQTAIESQLTGAPNPARKVPMNITLPKDYKDRLTAAARDKHISASVLIQTWIDENC